MTERLAYRVPEVCAMLGISRATLYRRVKTGDLTIHKLGSISLIKRGDVELLLKKPIHVLVHVSALDGSTCRNRERRSVDDHSVMRSLNKNETA